MKENNYYFNYFGNIKEWPGIKLIINEKKTHNEIGYIFLTDVDEAYDYDIKIKNELSNIEDHTEYNFIRENETIFLHNLFINEKYRNKGFGKLIRKKTEEVATEYNYKYLTSITNKNNPYSNKINESLDYKILENLKEYNFFYKKL
jgi:GNAT superfamily N-acetyltransferase